MTFRVTGVTVENNIAIDLTICGYSSRKRRQNRSINGCGTI